MCCGKQVAKYDLLISKTILSVFGDESSDSRFPGFILYRAESQRMKGVSFITEAEADLISTSSMHLLHDT